MQLPGEFSTVVDTLSFAPLLSLPRISTRTPWNEMRVAARPENRFKPRRLILTFSYRFAKFPNSFFSLHRASQPPGLQKLPLPMGGNTVSKFPYLPYFVRSANPALCKLRFIPQTANVFSPSILPLFRDRYVGRIS